MEEGMAMVDRAKSFVSNHHQNAVQEAGHPVPPPEGQQPPEGDHQHHQ